MLYKVPLHVQKQIEQGEQVSESESESEFKFKVEFEFRVCLGSEV